MLVYPSVGTFDQAFNGPSAKSKSAQVCLVSNIGHVHSNGYEHAEHVATGILVAQSEIDGHNQSNCSRTVLLGLFERVEMLALLTRE